MVMFSGPLILKKTTEKLQVTETHLPESLYLSPDTAQAPKLPPNVTPLWVYLFTYFTHLGSIWKVGNI